MNDQLLDFLIQKYGNRIDKKENLSETDNQTIAEQLKLVETQIGNTRMMGIVWMVIGPIWLILSFYSLFTSEIDLLNVIKVILGISYISLGFYNFFQRAELKRKKVILETILFVNKGNG